MNREPHVATRKRPKKQVGKLERIAIWVVLAGVAFVFLVFGIMWLFTETPLRDWEFLHRPIGGSKAISPEVVDLEKIAANLESLPPQHLPMAELEKANEGFMRIVTGENSASVRAIPDHPGLYQIDITRYAVAYDDFPSKPRTRNYLTVLLIIGTEFDGYRWKLMDCKASAADEISQPGRSPDRETREGVSKREAEFFARPIINFLNGVPFDDADAEHAAAYEELHAAFEEQNSIRDAIEAQGIQLPR